VPPVPSVFDTSDDIDDAAYPATGEYKTSEDIGSDEFKTNEDVHTKDLPDSVRSRTGQDDAAPVELDATVPFIALERNAVSAAADEEVEEDAEEDFGFTGEYSAAAVSSAEPEEMIAEREPVSIPTAVPVEPGGGSSTGKYVAILLGLGAVLVLLFGSALGIGWYYYSGGFGGGDQTPVPTPVTTPSVEETPFETPAEATPELTPEASPENTASPEASPESTIESTPGRTPSATPRRTPSRTPGKTPAATPVKTPPPTPRPTPKKTPRTLPTILQ
jgi:hypothetical protein